MSRPYFEAYESDQLFAEIKLYSAPSVRGSDLSSFNPSLNASGGVRGYEVDRYIEAGVL